MIQYVKRREIEIQIKKPLYLRMTMTISEPVRIICPKDNYTYEDKYTGAYSSTKCPNCFFIFNIDKNGKPTRSQSFYKRFKDVVGFGQDPKTGLEVAIDTRGKHIAVDETRYDFKKDPHGWKATGKKVKGYARK